MDEYVVKPRIKANQTYTISSNGIDNARSGLNDEVAIVIPDTPSPVFSKFAGKRDRMHDLDRSHLECVRKKMKRSIDTSSNMDKFIIKNKGSSDPKEGISSKRTKHLKHSSNQELDDNNHKVHSDKSSKYFNNLWDECMKEADEVNLYRVNSPKKLKSKHFKPPLEIDSDCEQQLTFSKPKSKIETVTQDLDQDSCKEALTSSANQPKISQRRTEDTNISNKFSQLNMERQKRLERLFDDSLSPDEFMELPMPKRKNEASPKFKFNYLHWPSDSSSESDSNSDYSDTIPLREILGKNSSEKKKKLNHSKNDQRIPNKVSDCDSLVSKVKPEKIREGRQNYAAKKDNDERKFFSKAKKDNDEKKFFSKAKNDNDEKKFFSKAKKDNDEKKFFSKAKKDNDEKKFFSKPKLPSRHSATSSQRSSSNLNTQKKMENVNLVGQPNKTRVRQLSGPDVTVISVSSNDSFNSNDLPHDHDVDKDNITNNTASGFSPVHIPSEASNQFRPSYVSPRFPVPGLLRRGSRLERRTERSVEDTDSPPSPLIPSQVLPSSSVSPPGRDPCSLSPHLLNRTRSVRSHKGHTGRHGRQRNLSRDRVSSHGTEFTSASALLTPRSNEAAQQIQQHQADEDFARRLQEEMDMEFAMSLHNMENRPPPDPVGPPGINTAVQNSVMRPPGPVLYGLEDIESFLTQPDDIGNNGLEQMLRATMTRTPPRTRNRQRGSRRQPASSNLDAISRMEAHLMSILDNYGTPPTRGQNRRGRRFFPTPADDGQDYEELLNLAEMIGDVKQKGLSKHQLTKLPERKYQLCPGEDVKECLVCMSEFEERDLLRILPCFHEFHTPCIDKWIMGNATCPVCRVQVNV